MPPTTPSPAADRTRGARRRGPNVYLGLGSNLGARRAFLSAAVAALVAREGIANARVSKLYETDAVSDDPQPPYLNAVVRGEALMPAAELLELCLAVEAGMGRVRPPAENKAPRPLDIDVLLYADEVIDTPRLKVPHPAMLERPFVLIPLADVAESGLLHPLTGTPLTEAAPSPQVRIFDAGGAWP
jgi:2-amino-4-hydroxy-6-hydroxymethyldihydropteridine diphosphokinase